MPTQNASPRAVIVYLVCAGLVALAIAFTGTLLARDSRPRAEVTRLVMERLGR